MLLLRKQKRHRKKKSVWRPPPLTVQQILDWADAHHARTGEWPKIKSGRIRGSYGTTWNAIDNALRQCRRGITVPSSLAKLLQAERGVRNTKDLPDLTVERVLAWADTYFAAHSQWPDETSGAIVGWPHDTWSTIETALCHGIRGFHGRSSLARLLSERRGRRNRKALPRYHIDEVLLWADRHFQRTGKWPTKQSGPISDVPGETWRALDGALAIGLRGLRGGSSLASLLVEHRGIRSHNHRRPLTPD